MPLRVMSYDGLHYRAQLRDLNRPHVPRIGDSMPSGFSPGGFL